MKIDEIDKNFKVETKLNKSDIVFHSIFDDPFRIYGLMYENGKFCRMPGEVANSIGGWLVSLNCNTTGGRVRFKTDSPYIAISAKMSNIGKMDHFAITGSGAFDMYVRENGVDKYSNTFRPPFDFEDGYESLFDFKFSKMREVCINFPLYSDVSELYIGLAEGSTIDSPTPYKYNKPIVYYGHSITQGACACRPGNAYPSILSRKFNTDFINLGFSGSARAEDQIIEYIASLDMQAFVYDYDHNAPNAEHLKATHGKMFDAIRRAHPNLPIIIMSSTTKESHLENRKGRRDVIFETYENAIGRGDKNVYFWDGSIEFAPHEDFGTVEGCHLNDYGFVMLAESLEKIMRNFLK
jgi:hypothetical protein